MGLISNKQSKVLKKGYVYVKYFNKKMIIDVHNFE